MRRLGLLRHAKSSWDTPGSGDFDRPLNGRGKRDAPRMGALLKSRGVQPQRIVSSTARRARTTAELVAAELGCASGNLIVSDELYLASAGRILAVLDDLAADLDDVIVVAHNPGMTDLANRIADARIDNLPTSGFFYVEGAVERWSDLTTRPGRLLFFAAPKTDLDPA